MTIVHTIVASQAGNECLNQINSEVSVEEVEKLMEDTEEAIAYQEEVSNLLAGNLTNDDVTDVNKELEILEKEDAEFRALQMEVDLPQAPTDRIKPPDVVLDEKKTNFSSESKKKAIVVQ